MNQLPDIYPGEFYLLLTPRPPQNCQSTNAWLRRQAANQITARLAMRGAVRVLDGGNRFDAYGLARALREKTHHLKTALQRVQVARAFTCYQMVTLLCETPASTTPTLVLELLTTFYDESLPLDERTRLLRESLVQLQRLRQRAPVVVTCSSRTGQSDPLLKQLEAAAGYIWHFEFSPPKPPLRLFPLEVGLRTTP